MLKFLWNRFWSAWHPYRSWAYGDPCNLVYMICSMALLIAAMLFVAGARVVALLIIAAGLLGIGLARHSQRTRSVAERIRIMVRKKLLQPRYNNPLHLEDGDAIPEIAVTALPDADSFILKIQSISVPPNGLQEMQDTITASLTGELAEYGVTSTWPNAQGCAVEYKIENLHKIRTQQETYKSSADIPCNPAYISIRNELGIDLTVCRNSSILIAGHTRSGKTSAIISILLQVLKAGPDKYGSRVVIIDPKNAELSQASSSVITIDDGKWQRVFGALDDFESCRLDRQRILNGLCKENGGNPVPWDKAGFHPSYLFIDEYIALMNTLPKKGSKLHPEYTQANFKSMLRRIMTQGASAGCFVILSTSQASVNAGDLDSTMKEACGVKILMRPNMEESLFIWRADQIIGLPTTSLGPGTAWISIDDGTHENPVFVRFPLMLFGEYAMLGKMLDDYNSNVNPASTLRQ